MANLYFEYSNFLTGASANEQLIPCLGHKFVMEQLPRASLEIPGSENSLSEARFSRRD